MLNKLIEFKLFQIFESVIKVDKKLKDTLELIDSKVSKDILSALDDEGNLETETDIKGISSIGVTDTPNYLGVQRPRSSSSNEKMKIGRFIKTLSSKYTDEDINQFIRKYNALYDVKYLDVKFLSGEEIAKAYKKSSTLCSGELGKSCMLDKDDFFTLYVENPDKVKLAVLYNEEGLITARALIWNTDQGDVVIDRVYASSQKLKGLMEQWGKVNGYVQLYGTDNIDILKYTVTLDDFKFPSNYPFLDTFKYLSDTGVLSNIKFEKQSYYILQDANGFKVYKKYKFWEHLDTQIEDIMQIEEFLHGSGVFDYKIHEDFSVTINEEYVDFSNNGLHIIPIKIREIIGYLNLTGNGNLDISRGGLPEYVKGSINLSYCNLKSLVGLPREIGGDLFIQASNLKNFIGGPIKVGGDLIATNCLIESFEGVPKEIGGNFDLEYNSIESLEGLSETSIGEIFDVSNNNINKINSFPKNIGKRIDISNNYIENLNGFPEEVNFSIRANSARLTSLEGSPKIVNGDFVINDNNFKNLIGAPRIINGICQFNYNHNLISLEGAPEEINGDLYIESCGRKFTEDGIREKTNVSGEVIC